MTNTYKAFKNDMSGSVFSSYSPSSTTPARRRSSIFSSIANFSLSGRSHTHSQSRRGSKWSITSCFSESSNSARNEHASQQTRANDNDDDANQFPPVTAAFSDRSSSSRRRSYVPKSATESFSTSATPGSARGACAPIAPMDDRAAKRRTYATLYGYRGPSAEMSDAGSKR